MISVDHKMESAPGVVGTGISWGAGFIAMTSHAVPVLQAVALLVSIVAGILTIIWTYKRIRGHDK